jgi:hypothetical protein
MSGEEEAIPTEKISAELLIKKASRAGKNLQEIRREYPRTAKVLLLYSRIVEKEVPNDPDALAVRDMALGFQFDYEGNSRNYAQAIAGREIKSISPQRVNQGLDRLVDITSNQEPQALLERTQQLALNNQALLMSEWRGGKSRTEELLRRQTEIYEAIEELKPR